MSEEQIKEKAAAEAVFLESALGLLRQNRKSLIDVDGEDRCRYLSDDGCSCAIGLLMEHPELAQEGSSWLAQHEALGAEKMKALSFYVLDEYGDSHGLGGKLQSLHDFNHQDFWFEKLKDIAQLFEFDYSSVQSEFGHVDQITS